MSFVFALVIGESEENGGTDAEKLLRGLSRGLRSLDMGEALANLDRLQLPGAERLSGRELEIVARLVSGDRVPAIARGLFLSPSTVRNHLSNVFGKLRVSSQQELITMLRERTAVPSREL